MADFLFIILINFLLLKLLYDIITYVSAVYQQKKHEDKRVELGMLTGEKVVRNDPPSFWEGGIFPKGVGHFVSHLWGIITIIFCVLSLYYFFKTF